MKYRLPAFLVFSAFSLSAVPSFAQHGGHGGGSFSGDSMGHFGENSSGHSSGSHSAGRGHGGSRAHNAHGEQPPPAGSAMHGRIVQLPTPGFHIPRPSRFRHPVTEFGFGNRGFFGFGAFSALGLCSPFGGFPNRFFWGGGFDCFNDDFFFDPFFFGGFFPGAVGGIDGDGALQSSELESVEADVVGQDSAAYPNYQTTLVSDQPAPEPRSAKAKPTILLQLTDGSMYGLTDYWVVDDRLHYVTDYGGQNSVPLLRIDFDKTNQLNAERGVRFYVQPEGTKR